MKHQQFKYWLILGALVVCSACAGSTAQQSNVNRTNSVDNVVITATPTPANVAVVEREPDVPYVPTHELVVDEMLKMAQVKGTDVLYDLGSGDGRIPIRRQKASEHAESALTSTRSAARKQTKTSLKRALPIK